MALGSRTEQSPCVNPPANSIRKQDELAGQGPVQRFNVGSNKAPTKAPTLPEALPLPIILPSTKDFFTRFMKVFMKII